MTALLTEVPFRLRRTQKISGRIYQAGDVADVGALPLHTILAMESTGIGMRVSDPVDAEGTLPAFDPVVVEPEIGDATVDAEGEVGESAAGTDDDGDAASDAEGLDRFVDVEAPREPRGRAASPGRSRPKPSASSKKRKAK